jgi:hypothetical protein
VHENIEENFDMRNCDTTAICYACMQTSRRYIQDCKEKRCISQHEIEISEVGGERL